MSPLYHSASLAPLVTTDINPFFLLHALNPPFIVNEMSRVETIFRKKNITAQPSSHLAAAGASISQIHPTSVSVPQMLCRNRLAHP